MSDVFPKWTNSLPRKLALAALVVSAGAVSAIGYYFTPKYTQSAYQPIQPVAFSHKTHCAQLEMDCRYCHNGVEKSASANLPATSTCLNCHGQVLQDDLRLDSVRLSASTGLPIPWVRIQKLPDYTYFNHAVHTQRGVGCVDCHGRVDQVDEVKMTPMSMANCLDCHRNPARSIRPLDKITQMDWPGTNSTSVDAASMAKSLQIQPRESCSACHR